MSCRPGTSITSSTSRPCLSPFIGLAIFRPTWDLSRGFEEYTSGLRKAGRDELKQTNRKGRKIGREVGPLRFELRSDRADVFDLLLNWKSQQYRRTKVTDVFALPWTTQLLRELWQQSTGFVRRATVGSLRRRTPHRCSLRHAVASRVALVVSHVRSALASYSPGRVLLAELARACASEGIGKLDLGRGVAPYKARVMSGATRVLEGSVDLRPVARHLRSTWLATRELVRNSPLHGPARVPGRIIHRLREWAELR